MMKRFALTAIAAATFTTVALGAAIATPAAAQSFGVYIGTPAPRYYYPPPPVQYAPPYQPVWVPGSWQWYGGRQVWVDGRWVSGPRAPYWRPAPWRPGWHHGWDHD